MFFSIIVISIKMLSTLVLNYRWIKNFSLVQNLKFQGKAENNSSYGPLTDLPDYTYLDGRPTELSTCQTRRQQKRIALASRVMLLISEMKQGQENYQYRLGLAEKERKEIVQKRLKPKPRYTFKKN